MKRSNLCNGTLDAIRKISVKTPNILIKMAFFVDFALFFRRIDGLLRYGTKGYGTFEILDKKEPDSLLYKNI